MSNVVVPAWENVIVERTAAALKPGEQGFSSRLNQLELYGPFCFLLHHDGAIANATGSYNVANTHLDDVTAAKLAVDGKVEQCTITEATVLIEPKTDCPNLLRFERALGAERSAFVPGANLMKRRVH
jgi:hypothetical protein